ncbi:MAG: 2-C-methyl-D-erythritol 4-phosphate cytidylyltransferase [Acidimicrobiales bacterium]
MSVWAIVVAGGKGLRLGADQPKQFLEIAGRRVLDWSVDAARSVADGVVVVLPPELVDGGAPPVPGADAVVAGGAERADSVARRLGGRARGGDDRRGARQRVRRPRPSCSLPSCCAVRSGAAGAVPGLPVADTIKVVEHGVIVDTLPRDALVRVQTPQAFDAAVLRQAHAAGPDATDDAAVVEAAGYAVVVVPGDERNRKLTVGPDLAVLEADLQAFAAAGR